MRIPMDGDKPDFSGLVDDIKRRVRDPLISDEEMETIREQRARRETRRILEASGLSAVQKEYSLANYQLHTPEQSQAYRIASKFIEHCPSVKRGLMLHGPSGCGKSRLLASVLTELANRQVSVFYISCLDLDRLLHADRRARGLNPSLEERMLSVQVLGIDDIEKGLSGAPEWVSSTIKGTLDYADREGTPVLVSTSEFPLESNEEDSHADHLPKWLVGRLKALFHWQFITGPNWREIEHEEKPWWAG